MGVTWWGYGGYAVVTQWPMVTRWLNGGLMMDTWQSHDGYMVVHDGYMRVA